jgi:hypothetical protein
MTKQKTEQRTPKVKPPQKVGKMKVHHPKQDTLDVEFNEIVRELESRVDVDNSVIANNSGNNK